MSEQRFYTYGDTDEPAVKEQLKPIYDDIRTLFGCATEAHARLDALVQRVAALEEGNDSQRIDVLSEIVGELGGRLTALESLYRDRSAPRAEVAGEFDPEMCACGHLATWHRERHRECTRSNCGCQVFVVPAPTPEAAPAHPVDPVLFHICEAYRLAHKEPYSKRVNRMMGYLEKCWERSMNNDDLNAMFRYGIPS